MTETIFQKSQKKQHAYSLPADSEKFRAFAPPTDLMRREPLALPEISELDLTRHFNSCAKKNMGIDTNFYPLGSCTMKLNPRINEWCAQLPAFARGHPLAADEFVQGNLKVIWELLDELCQICGMTAGTLAPNAGAQGEFTGIQMIAHYHRMRDEPQRIEMIIPDDAHGTNPATTTMVGLKAVSVSTNETGDIDLEELRSLVSERTAGLMLTNPNTLGLFSPNILEIAQIIHKAGGLLYYDGANLNPILHVARPGEMGFDVMHINLHKTFSTPHGGGGPGAGPVLCNDKLKDYLPTPWVEKSGEWYRTVWNDDKSIGRISSFRGNFAICLRAYLYIKLHGSYGLRKVAEQAVLNANYLKKQMGQFFTIPFEQPCMHEFVVQADRFLGREIRALDIAKRLLDYGMHAPTIYFPLIIKECMLVEPTECESKETLDAFIEAIAKIVSEIEETPELVEEAPHTMPVKRLDEVRAAKNPILHA